jgi:hypothetical protein
MAVRWVDGGSDSSSCGGGALALALRGTSGSVLLLATVGTASGHLRLAYRLHRADWRWRVGVAVPEWQSADKGTRQVPLGLARGVIA